VLITSSPALDPRPTKAARSTLTHRKRALDPLRGGRPLRGQKALAALSGSDWPRPIGPRWGFGKVCCSRQSDNNQSSYALLRLEYTRSDKPPPLHELRTAFGLVQHGVYMQVVRDGRIWFDNRRAATARKEGITRCSHLRNVG
jgi:hypothetical protein